jgi:drug/metabolite transporter (DMT)-like permease
MWLFLAILTGLLFGIQSVLIKRLSSWFPQNFVLQYLFLIAAFILLPFVFAVPFPAQPGRFVSAFSISLLINIVAYSLLFYAIRITPVSLVMPFVGFTPLFSTVSAYFILRETVSLWQLAGIGAILLGGFILQIPDKRKTGKGIQRFLNLEEKGIGLVLLVALLWSISASVEKIAVQSSSVFFYGFTIHLALGIIFGLSNHLRNRRRNPEIKPSRMADREKAAFLLGLGLVSGFMAYTQLSAILLTNVSVVIAFKRAGILVSSLAGIFYLKEPGTSRVLLGTLTILTGTALISLF